VVILFVSTFHARFIPRLLSPTSHSKIVLQIIIILVSR
jgi:hypothetical protein